MYSQLFGCQIGSCPFKYLGILMHYKKLNNIDWKALKQRIEKKLSSWKGKLLSVGGRLVLINSILTSMVIFMLSFFKVSERSSLRRYNILGPDFYGKMMNTRKTTY
jgi:hypothetical protein